MNGLCRRGGGIGPKVKVNQNLRKVDRRCSPVWANRMDIPTVLLSTQNISKKKQDKQQQQSE
jgi:hypothetical protein